MLAYLHVKNIALIEELEIDFHEGLNILTGETGAGKSIILGSIHYVLGAKIKKDFIRQGADEAFVECVFDMSDDRYDQMMIKGLLEENGITDNGETILMNRKTAHNGRSVFRINGEVVRQDVVRDISGYLIDIHSQHEHQSLLNNDRQLDMLDRYSGEGLEPVMVAYQKAYQEYKERKHQLSGKYDDDDMRRREISFLEYEIAEIEKAELIPGEDDAWQDTYDRLSHRRTILETLSHLNNELFESVDVDYVIARGTQDLERVLRFDSELSSIHETLTQIEDLMTTLKRDISLYNNDSEAFDEKLFEAEQRLDVINTLKLKYGETIEDILDYGATHQKKLDELLHYEERIEANRKAVKELEDQLYIIAVKMHDKRMDAARILGKQITQTLRTLNLEHAAFQVLITETKGLTYKGTDKVEFLISTNKGEALKPLKEVASGGELSRVMLAVKSILATVDGIDTLVFDEIDTGISGLTAQKVGEVMRQLAQERQLICITHLPQIAAMSNVHFLIHKEVEGEKTRTYMDRLSDEESIQALAQMLSGAVTSDVAIANAKEMKYAAQHI